MYGLPLQFAMTNEPLGCIWWIHTTEKLCPRVRTMCSNLKYFPPKLQILLCRVLVTPYQRDFSEAAQRLAIHISGTQVHSLNLSRGSSCVEFPFSCACVGFTHGIPVSSHIAKTIGVNVSVNYFIFLHFTLARFY